MDKANHAIFGAARDALKEKLQEAYLGPLFLRNHGWAWVGLQLMLAAMLFVGAVMAFADIYAELGERMLPAAGFVLMIGSVLAGINSRFARTDGSWALAALAALLLAGGGRGVAAQARAHRFRDAAAEPLEVRVIHAGCAGFRQLRVELPQHDLQHTL